MKDPIKALQAIEILVSSDFCAKPQTKKLPMLGTYAHVRCGNCGSYAGNWFTGTYGFVDCRCLKDGGVYRTVAKLSPPNQSNQSNKESLSTNIDKE